MKYKIVYNSSEVDKKNWNNFIFENPNGNFFQIPKIYDFYKDLKGYKPIPLFCFDNTGNITGFLLAIIQKEKGFLKGKLSSRCIIYGGPVLNNNNNEAAGLLLKKLIETVKKKSIYIEFRNLFDISESAEVFRENGFNYKDHFNFIFKIENPEENFKKININKRRQIRKSLEAGAEIFEPENINQVKEFYLILKNLYNNKVKKPLPGFSFFEIFFYTPAFFPPGRR